MTNETSTIVLTVPRIDKARFVQAAYPGKLSEWILKTLRKQAVIDLKEPSTLTIHQPEQPPI